MDEKRPLCRFDMFTRRKKESIQPLKNAKEIFTYRGDQYSEEPAKMLQLLLAMVLNYRKQFAIMLIRDNTKPKNSPERNILKMLNGKVFVNRILNYPDLIQDFPLPEWLSYSIDPEANSD